MNYLYIILLLHVASTLYMSGVIWLIQLVHYPLFDRVAPDQFVSFEQDHSHWITYVVLPPMVLELLTAVALCVFRPAGVSSWILFAGLSAVLIIWISTFAIQVPQHTILAQGYDAVAHSRLVAGNWIRTVAWSIRSVFVLVVLYQVVTHSQSY